MASRIRFELNDSDIRRNIDELDIKLDNAITLVTEFHATTGEAKMKSGAPWTDRTGAARVGLHTSAQHGSGKHQIVFAHSVSYGIWLEVKNSGKYEIIMPTVREEGAALMRNLNGLMRNLR